MKKQYIQSNMPSPFLEIGKKGWLLSYEYIADFTDIQRTQRTPRLKKQFEEHNVLSKQTMF